MTPVKQWTCCACRVESAALRQKKEGGVKIVYKSLEDGQKNSKTLYSVFLHAQRSTERRRVTNWGKDRDKKNLPFLVNINKLKDGSKNPVQAAVEPEKNTVWLQAHDRRTCVLFLHNSTIWYQEISFTCFSYKTATLRRVEGL